MDQPQKDKKRREGNSFIKYSSLGFEMAAIIVLGTWGGFKLDQWLQNEFKVLTLITMVISVVISIIHGTKNLLKK